MFVTLRCKTCGKMNCEYARDYIQEDSEEGCTRQVSEESAEKFIHDTQEVLPFLRNRPRTESTDKTFSAIEENFKVIYSSSLGRLIDSKGKIDMAKEKKFKSKKNPEF